MYIYIYIYIHTYTHGWIRIREVLMVIIITIRTRDSPGTPWFRESIEVRESARVVLGDYPQKGWCGVLLTLVSCCPRSLRDLPP